MNKIFWIDLEMTGLNVEIERIIEVGAIVTDLDFNELDKYHAVVNQPDTFLENMDEWNQKHHTESGLVEKVKTGKLPRVVEQELIEFSNCHFSDEKPIIAGNSISQDRLFLDTYFKKFAKLLHYRMLDVSSWKLIFKHKFERTFEKETAHRALDDIRESIAELKYYLEFVKFDSTNNGSDPT